MTTPRRRPPDYTQVDGMRCWHDSNGQPHSVDDLPAITRPNGEEIYYRHGIIHRELGPAHIHPDGRGDWYHHGRQLTAAEIDLLRPFCQRASAVPCSTELMVMPRLTFKPRKP